MQHRTSCVHTYRVETTFGTFTMGEEQGFLVWLALPNRTIPSGGVPDGRSPLLLRAKEQLLQYLAGNLQTFDLPLAPQGTPFQQKVWAVLATIPYGQTVSYREVALRVGCPKGYRAVGLANNRNPIPIFIPCHRVVGADGSLTGYGGGLALKRRLLELESAQTLAPCK